MERAVIYSRVSTDEEIQINALSSQIQEARQAVEKNGWILVDEYIDEGKSGTTIKNRNEYNRLTADLERDEFDIIVCKSQDRLMRNTREWYIFVDKLIQSKKRLYFYLENKFYSTDDALITGIKAILAEEYSRDLSKKTSNAHKHRQESGSNVVLTSNTWGYDKVGKKIVVNEAEAEIIRLMYRMCCEGKGSRTISKELQNRGLRSRSNKNFSEVTIRRIIRNPLYKGTVVMNKRHIDFESKKTIAVSEKDWIVHEGLVPAIIDADLWQAANDRMDERSEIMKSSDFAEKRRGVNIGKYGLSGKIVCGDCGANYWRRYRKNARNEQLVDWYCSEYINRGRKTNDTKRGKSREKIKSDGGCDNIHIKEKQLLEVLYDVSKLVFGEQKDDLLNMAMKILGDVIEGNHEEELQELKTEQESIMQKRDVLLEKNLDGLITDDLFRHKDKSFAERCGQLEEKIAELEKVAKDTEKRMNRLTLLKDEVVDITNKDLTMKKLLQHIEKITVYHDHASVQFDMFDSIDIRIERKNYRTVIMSVCSRRYSSWIG